MNCISTLWSVVQKLAGINTCTSVSEPVIAIKNNILPLTYLTILGPYNHANITNLHTNKYNKNQINRPNALCQSEVIVQLVNWLSLWDCQEKLTVKGFPGALSMITVDFLINPDNEITNEWCLSALPTSNTETTPAVDRPGLILM